MNDTASTFVSKYSKLPKIDSGRASEAWACSERTKMSVTVTVDKIYSSGSIE
jgi:hypothetical protein